jgi:hypothetical protein
VGALQQVICCHPDESVLAQPTWRADGLVLQTLSTMMLERPGQLVTLVRIGQILLQHLPGALFCLPDKVQRRFMNCLPRTDFNTVLIVIIEPGSQQLQPCGPLCWQLVDHVCMGLPCFPH